MEFLALRKPMLLVPLPLSASRATRFSTPSLLFARLCHVLPQEEMQVDSLVQAIKLLYNQKDAVVAAQIQAEVPDGTQTVLSLIDSVRQGKRRINHEKSWHSFSDRCHAAAAGHGNGS